MINPNKDNLLRHFEYLPVTETEIQRKLYLTGAGASQTTAGQTYPPQEHPQLYAFRHPVGRVLPEFQLFIITEGQGELHTPTGQYTIQTGDAVLLQPGIWHSYQPDPTSGWTENWLSFNGDYLHELAKQNIINPNQPITRPQNPEQLAQEIQKLLSQILSHPGENRFEWAVAGLACLLSARQSDQDTQVDSNTTPNKQAIAVQSALTHIWSTNHRDLGVDMVCEAAETNRRTLERWFRSVRNRTIHEEIEHCRLCRAQALLSQTDIPIKQVAYAAGFTSPEQMSRVFNLRLSLSPSDFRKHHHNAGLNHTPNHSPTQTPIHAPTQSPDALPTNEANAPHPPQSPQANPMSQSPLSA